MTDSLAARLREAAGRFSLNADPAFWFGADLMNEAAVQLERAASAQQGFVSVPREPTDEMLVAGQEAWAWMRVKRNPIEGCEEAAAVYRAMLIAATYRMPISPPEEP